MKQSIRKAYHRYWLSSFDCCCCCCCSHRNDITPAVITGC